MTVNKKEYLKGFDLKLKRVLIRKTDLDTAVLLWTQPPAKAEAGWHVQIDVSGETLAAQVKNARITVNAQYADKRSKQLYAEMETVTELEIIADVPMQRRIEFLTLVLEMAVNHLTGMSSQALEHTVLKNTLPMTDNEMMKHLVHRNMYAFWN